MPPAGGGRQGETPLARDDQTVLVPGVPLRGPDGGM